MRNINGHVDIGSRWRIPILADTIPSWSLAGATTPACDALTSNLRPNDAISFHLPRFTPG